MCAGLGVWACHEGWAGPQCHSCASLTKTSKIWCQAKARCPAACLQPPAVVEIMKSDHHNWALKKMGGWVQLASRGAGRGDTSSWGALREACGLAPLGL